MNTHPGQNWDELVAVGEPTGLKDVAAKPDRRSRPNGEGANVVGLESFTRGDMNRHEVETRELQTAKEMESTGYKYIYTVYTLGVQGDMFIIVCRL